jgi:hypothetical protein
MLSFEGLQKRVDDRWEPKDEHEKRQGRGLESGSRPTSAAIHAPPGLTPPVFVQCSSPSSWVTLRRHDKQVRRRSRRAYTRALAGEMERAREQFDRWLTHAADRRAAV